MEFTEYVEIEKMLRKNGTVLPYNEISHLRMENLNFVLNLRSTEEGLKRKPETRARVKEQRDVEQTPIEASVSELKMAANVKCGLPGCVEVGNQMYAAMAEVIICTLTLFSTIVNPVNVLYREQNFLSK